MVADRYVVYMAVGERDAGADLTVEELRVRTYGGPLPAEKDLEYRNALAGRFDVLVELSVADLPFVDGHAYPPVNGFWDAREPARAR